MYFSRRSVTTLFCLGITVSILAGCAGSRSRLKVGKNEKGEIVEAEGYAPNDPTDILKTKRGSLVDAQRNAVEKAVGVFVSARTLVEKAVAIENNILAKTDGYVKKYEILKESVEGNLYKTKIRALVALKDIEEDLKGMSLLKAPELIRPRVQIDIVEEVNKERLEDEPARNSLQKILQEQGFVIVQPERAREADLLIKGKAQTYPFQATGLGGFVSYRARMSIQAIRAGTSDVVMSLSKEASGLGGNADLAALKALETVGELTGRDLSTQLPEAWLKGKNMLVMVEGVKSFEDVDRVKKHLSAQPGVTDVVLRFYEDQMAQFELLLGSIRSSELATGLSASRTLPLKILEASPQTLRLELEAAPVSK